MPEAEKTGADLALAVVRSIRTNSPAVAGFNIDIRDASPGRVQLAMQLQPTMLNAQGLAHGGYLFALADTCAACAALSYNQLAVTQTATIQYLAPGPAAELVATASEVTRAGRTAVYDVEIRGQDRLIVLVRTVFRLLEGSVI